ncbi:discoidin domain-containing protein, partial [Formosa undariae]
KEATPVSVVASSSTNPENTLDDNPATSWSAQGDGEYLIYDLGDIYELNDLKISFEDKLTKNSYFDIQVSRENETYLEVKQDLSSNKTADTYDTYSISRKARYIKIIGRGNETDDWNTINDVKFYFNDESLSIDDNELAKSDRITLYPVPAKNTLNIKGITKDTTVQIYNITGALVQSTAIR